MAEEANTRDIYLTDMNLVPVAGSSSANDNEDNQLDQPKFNQTNTRVIDLSGTNLVPADRLDTTVPIKAQTYFNKETYADFITPALEVLAAVQEGGKGFAEGARGKAGPSAALFGAIGAIKTTVPRVAGATFVGETLEDYIEGNSFNPDRAFKLAFDSAVIEAAMTGGTSLLFPLATRTGELIKDTAPIVLGRAKDIVPNEALDEIANLQKKLANYNATLLPNMVKDGIFPNLATAVASVSLFTKNRIETLAKNYDLYMGNQLRQTLDMLPSNTPYTEGKMIQAYITQADEALKAIVKPIYGNLDLLSKNKQPVRLRELAQLRLKQIDQNPKFRRQDDKGKITVKIPGSEAKSTYDTLGSLPDNFTFMEAHEYLSSVKSDLRSLRNVREKSTDQNDAILVLQELEYVLRTGLDNAAKNLDGQAKKQYDEVTAMYKKGKETIGTEILKSVLRVKEPKDVGAMLVQFGNEEGLLNIKEVMKLVAEYGTRITPQQVVAGTKKEREAFVTMQEALAKNPLLELRRGFVENLFGLDGATGMRGIAKYRQLRNDRNFNATFKTLFNDAEGEPIRKQLDLLVKELEILEKGPAGAPAFSLLVPSQEIGVVRDATRAATGETPSITGSLLPLLLTPFSVKSISKENVDSMINGLKLMNKAAEAGNRPLTRNIYNSLLKFTADPKFQAGKAASLGKYLGVGSISFLDPKDEGQDFDALLSRSNRMEEKNKQIGLLTGQIQ